MKKVLIPFFLFLVAIIVIDKLLLPYYIGKGRTATVPDVRNLAYDDAVGVLRRSKLNAMKNYSMRYLPDVPSDKVIDQVPAPSSIVKPGRYVLLLVNRTDKPGYPVPDLTGRTEAEARQELERLGMIISAVQSQAVSESERDGRVLSQSVPPNVILKSGSPVSFIVGKLEQESRAMIRIVVPDVLGMSLDQARAMIIRNGLAVGRIRYERSSLLVPDTVVNQNPSPNAMVPSSQPVELTVATGQD
ncbi:MAG: PASTA domain-containing protein [Chlorobiaceae bacterium]|nr:PASTA domain-containing protein [Chlorobiaceae bacterium]